MFAKLGNKENVKNEIYHSQRFTRKLALMTWRSQPTAGTHHPWEANHCCRWFTLLIYVQNKKHIITTPIATNSTFFPDILFSCNYTAFCTVHCSREWRWRKEGSERLKFDPNLEGVIAMPAREILTVALPRKLPSDLPSETQSLTDYPHLPPRLRFP